MTLKSWVWLDSLTKHAWGLDKKNIHFFLNLEASKKENLGDLKVDGCVIIRQVFHCCTVHVASTISLIFQLMHTHNIHTLKSTNIYIKTLKNSPLYVSVPFLRPSSGGSWTVLCQDTMLRSVDIRSLWNCVATWLYCDYFIWGLSCTVVVLTRFAICGCGTASVV
jgi:hypothetical protein